MNEHDKWKRWVMNEIYFSSLMFIFFYWFLVTCQKTNFYWLGRFVLEEVKQTYIIFSYIFGQVILGIIIIIFSNIYVLRINVDLGYWEVRHVLLFIPWAFLFHQLYLSYAVKKVCKYCNKIMLLPFNFSLHLF